MAYSSTNIMILYLEHSKYHLWYVFMSGLKISCFWVLLGNRPALHEDT
jgi:hypothetical protein